MSSLSIEIANFLNLKSTAQNVGYRVVASSDLNSYTQSLIEYSDEEGGVIPAYLLLPKGGGPFPAVVIHHQHNGERHFGKSEVCGLAGDPLQAFGPALAEKGFIVLAPDSICFEDRRMNAKGTTIDTDGDWLQHFNEMTYRLVRGDTLMRKVLDDASIAANLLRSHPSVDHSRIGLLGHSYGGNTVLFQLAVDPNFAFGCSSGAACSYKNKFESRTGLEMALAIPGFASQWDFSDLIVAARPVKTALVSATNDIYSKDADDILRSVEASLKSSRETAKIFEMRYEGGHAMTQERFGDIVAWITENA